MGFSAKKSKKVQVTDSDSDEYNDMEYEEVVRDEDDFDEDDGEEEELEEDDGEEEEEDGEEEGEEEDGEEQGEEEDGEAEEEDDGEFGTDEEEDEAVERIERENEEMEQLEKEYRELHHQEIDTLKNLKHHKDEDLLKGQAVKSQKALWYKILELRFLLQKPFSSSNRLPQEPIKSSFCETDETVSVAYSNLVTSSKETLDSILELQEALFAKNPSITQATYGSERLSKDLQVSKQLDDNFDQEWSQICQTHKRIASFRDKSINKWQRMTQVTTGAAAIKGKLHAFNQDISNQIATYMRDPSRMRKQMQLRRSAVSIFGSVPEAKDNTEEEALTDADPELVDDSEFYQQLLKEFFETVDPSSSEKAFYALKRMQTKKRKIVDRRASKSRKIRYNVHEKIVNFMASQPMNIPPMAPMLFDNLFGLKSES